MYSWHESLNLCPGAPSSTLLSSLESHKPRKVQKRLPWLKVVGQTRSLCVFVRVCMGTSTITLSFVCVPKRSEEDKWNQLLVLNHSSWLLL